MLQRHPHEQSLLQDVDGNDNSLGISWIVDDAFNPVERPAGDFHPGALLEQWMQAQLQAGGDHHPDVLELAQKPGLVLNPDGAHQQILLIDAALGFRGDLGEDIPRKERFGEAFRLVAVAPHTGHERQVVGESLDGEQGREFFLAPRLGVTREPARFGKGGQRFSHAERKKVTEQPPAEVRPAASVLADSEARHGSLPSPAR